MERDIAKKLGAVQQYISKIENGHENLSMDTLARIAAVFEKGLVIKLR
ncbi:MAG: helix-turn-helix transcriptional regulator [Bacteroidales bacterium]|nr:helix-turn-helix transcriptional regulator [Bacteroidales bacterium]